MRESDGLDSVNVLTQLPDTNAIIMIKDIFSMDQTGILPLIHNAALLLAMLFIFDLISRKKQSSNIQVAQIVTGFALGMIGIIIMLTPWELQPGIIFDTRSVLLGISGLFFGPLPTVIAMAMTASLRVSQGGAVFTGVAVILASGMIGIAWRQLRWGEVTRISLAELYLFGLLIHAIMIGLMFTLPWNIAIKVLSQITLPVLVIYPIATMMLGALLANRLEREEIAKSLQQSEFLFRSQFDLGNMGIAITTPEHRWHRVNPRLCEMLGYSEAELLATTWSKLTHAEDLNSDLNQFNRLMTGEIDNYELDKRFIRKDGDILYTRLTVSCHRVAGQVQFLVAGILDFSQSNRTEVELRTNLEQLTRVIDASRLGVWEWDITTDTIHRSAHWAAILGYTEAEIQDSSLQLLDFIHPDDRETAWRSITDHLQGKTNHHLMEYRLQTRQGSPLWILESAQIIERSKDGLPLKMCGTITDINNIRNKRRLSRQTEPA